MSAGYRKDNPDDAAGAAFIILAIGVLIIAGVLITSAFLIAKRLR
jgi:hypothetical protein